MKTKKFHLFVYFSARRSSACFDKFRTRKTTNKQIIKIIISLARIVFFDSGTWGNYVVTAYDHNSSTNAIDRQRKLCLYTHERTMSMSTSMTVYTDDRVAWCVQHVTTVIRERTFRHEEHYIFINKVERKKTKRQANGKK
jgi:hypothetical protein